MPTTVPQDVFKTERQRELMRVVREDFRTYRKREAHQYLLNGMSTSHIVLHAIRDYTTLRAFWPKHLVRDQGGQSIYELQPDTLGKVQDAVRDTLRQLHEMGLLEKLGNENERRWRVPRRELEALS
jgi:hypothetical protein